MLPFCAFFSDLSQLARWDMFIFLSFFCEEGFKFGEACIFKCCKVSMRCEANMCFMWAVLVIFSFSHNVRNKADSMSRAHFFRHGRRSVTTLEIFTAL